MSWNPRLLSHRPLPRAFSTLSSLQSAERGEAWGWVGFQRWQSLASFSNTKRRRRQRGVALCFRGWDRCSRGRQVNEGYMEVRLVRHPRSPLLASKCRKSWAVFASDLTALYWLMVRSKDFKQAVESIRTRRRAAWSGYHHRPPAFTALFFDFSSPPPRSQKLPIPVELRKSLGNLRMAPYEGKGGLGRGGGGGGVEAQCESVRRAGSSSSDPRSEKPRGFGSRSREAEESREKSVAAPLAQGAVGGGVSVRQWAPSAFASLAFTVCGQFFLCASSSTWEMVALP